MADGTHIEWTDATWNPIVGCSIVSPGCTNCYAMKLAGTRLKHIESRRGLTRDTKAGPVWTGEVRLNEQWLDQPLKWKQPRRIFVCAHGDLFAENVPDEWIDKVFAIMALAPQHTFQVLTKRAKRMREYFEKIDTELRAAGEHGYTPRRFDQIACDITRSPCAAGWMEEQDWPFPNVWLGVSAERQQEADERIPHLLMTPAAIRFVSAEPLLGPIDFTSICWRDDDADIRANSLTAEAWVENSDSASAYSNDCDGVTGLDWIIVGGESGPGARPMHPAWARSIRDQCAAAGVPFFFKQWGAWGLEEPVFGGHEMHALADDGTLYRSTDLAYPDGKRRGEAIRANHDQARLHSVYRVGKKAAGRLLDGIEHNAMPEAR
ncbi:MAG: DUF5131 family protein [Mesorhizobium sp.]|uniref:phage Gp37/Gp68 family protein n=1 Tax=unclassified Mesorhizobium TaxID=325217 RepID=UPI000FCAB0BF|nr:MULTISPECIES: phage Gp37/Gp68 family protein [unclassified Mesorhizobium]RUV65188.1 phage Gp37/Gp68 family protein [Mesorhizobium sp. M5C.F.Ca.IN.020.29.1.1]TIM87628.1 MAG: DUF5131 family protein [Mesorhizobium sp.]TIR33321.1 MAG: DUF5131 family protein [Mesorhizobium sp.]